MTFGCDLKVPQCVAKQGLNYLVLNSMQVDSGTGNRAPPSKVDFYISFCRLHHIIGEVLETFYISSDSNVGHGTSRNDVWIEPNSLLSFDKLASLFKIESELCNWAGNLHPFFQMPTCLEDLTPTKRITRQANVLRARYVS